MQTWTLVRYRHIVAITFFVGGQLLLVAAVAPALRRSGDEATMRLIARRFGIGSVVALGLAIATGVALASHFSLWDSNILQVKLMVLVLVGVLDRPAHRQPEEPGRSRTASSPRRSSSSGSASSSPTANGEVTDVDAAAPPMAVTGEARWIQDASASEVVQTLRP